MLQEPYRKALEAYSRGLAVADPIRLMFWDSRGLTMAQLRVMVLLRRNEQTPGQLAELMHVTRGTVTGLADKLVQTGLLTREEDSTDRRSLRLRLTTDGRQVLAAIELASVAYMEQIFAKLPESTLAMFTSALEEFAAAAKAVQIEGEWRP